MIGFCLTKNGCMKIKIVHNYNSVYYIVKDVMTNKKYLLNKKFYIEEFLV